MTTTTAAIGHGTLFQLKDLTPSPAVFTTIGEVLSITLPNLSRDAVDATHTESVNGWREFIPGLKDPGEVKIEMNFDFSNPSDDIIKATFNSDLLQTARILFPGSPTQHLTFSGIITGYEPTVPLDDKMTATLTFKVSGEITYLG